VFRRLCVTMPHQPVGGSAKKAAEVGGIDVSSVAR
jgi:hypothetical protein